MLEYLTCKKRKGVLGYDRFKESTKNGGFIA